MKLWNDLSAAYDSFSLNDIKNGGAALMNAYTQHEQSRSSSFQAAQADQAAARHAPEFESQNQGDPVSPRFAQPEKQLVGEESEKPGIDKKWLIAGGVGVVGLVVLVVMLKK